MHTSGRSAAEEYARLLNDGHSGINRAAWVNHGSSAHYALEGIKCVPSFWSPVTAPRQKTWPWVTTGSCRGLCTTHACIAPESADVSDHALTIHVDVIYIYIYIYTYIKSYMHIYIYIYIYMCLKRERERERRITHICVYIYIYIHIWICNVHNIITTYTCMKETRHATSQTTSTLAGTWLEPHNSTPYMRQWKHKRERPTMRMLANHVLIQCNTQVYDTMYYYYY